jgi:predicted component of type VI protein secretion system
MPPQLLALTDGPSILLDKPILLLGRHQECDIQLVSRKVSRRHCCIAQVNDYLVVRDLGSTNGIRINGVRVLEGNLKPGDELTIGNYRYEVRWDALGAEPPRRPGRGGALERNREPVSPMPRAVDDASLESCDEPVPLSEPAPRTEPRRPAANDPASVAEAADKSKSVPCERSLVLPENIELAPSNDVAPSLREPSPPSP